LIPAGELVIVPLPVPDLETLSVLMSYVKIASTDLAEDILTWQEPLPEQAPPQLVKLEP
jgi:hypothetical protein